MELGRHDDMVIALALVQATKEYRDNIVVLDGKEWTKRIGWADV